MMSRFFRALHMSYHINKVLTPSWRLLWITLLIKIAFVTLVVVTPPQAQAYTTAQATVWDDPQQRYHHSVYSSTTNDKLISAGFYATTDKAFVNGELTSSAARTAAYSTAGNAVGSATDSAAGIDASTAPGIDAGSIAVSAIGLAVGPAFGSDARVASASYLMYDEDGMTARTTARATVNTIAHNVATEAQTGDSTNYFYPRATDGASTSFRNSSTAHTSRSLEPAFGNPSTTAPFPSLREGAGSAYSDRNDIARYTTNSSTQDYYYGKSTRFNEAASGRAYSEITGEMSVGAIMQRIVMEMMDAQQVFVTQGMRILFWLGGLAFAFESGFLILNGRYDLASVVAVMVRIIFILGFLHICVMNGYMITSDLINSFASLAFEASDDMDVGKTISMLDKFFILCEDICKAVDTRNMFFSVIFMLSIYTCIAVLVVTYVVTYISTFFTAIICSVTLCFGALKYTSFIAKNYIMLLLAWGFRLFSFYFIIIIGQNILQEVVQKLNASIAAGHVLRIQDAGYLLITFISICCLSTICPKAISGMFMRAQN